MKIIKKQLLKIIEFIRSNEDANKIFKNANWLVGQQIFSMVLGVFVIAVVTRYFGPEKFGQFNYALAFVGLFTAISTLGMETLTVRAIVDDDYDEGTILCTSFFLRLVGGVLLTGLAVAIIKFIETSDQNLHILVLIMSLTMVFRSFEVIEYWIQAYQKAKLSSLIRMCIYIVTASLKVGMVIFKGTLITYALIYMLDAMIIGIALLIAYFRVREKVSPWRVSFAYAKNLLSQSWYLILSGLIVTLYMRVDQVMLGAMLPDKIELGIYSAAVRVAEMWYFVPMAIITSFKPVIMRNKSIDEYSYKTSVQALYTIVAWSGIGFGILILLFSKPIIGMLYGTEYLKAASILSISVWAGTFAMLGSARSVWLICEGLQKYSVVYISIGFVTNIALNFLLIPSYGGYGAAVATLVAQIVVAMVAPALFVKTRVSVMMMIRTLNFKAFIRYIGL